MNALKKIVRRAKAIRRSKPSVSWKSAVKKASAEYNKGSWQRGSSDTRSDSLRKAKKPGIRFSASGRKYSERRKNRSDAPGKLVGISQARSVIIHALKDRLMRGLMMREQAKTAAQRRAANEIIKQSRKELRKFTG